MNTSAQGQLAIKFFEAPGGAPCLKAYLDQRKIATIGWGTTHYPGGLPVQIGDTCTLAEARVYFDHDLAPVEAAIARFVTAHLSQQQFDALVSLTYNEGVRAIAGSTVVNLINQRQYGLAADHFLDWDKITLNGHLVPDAGLLARRKHERTIFLTGQY